MTENKDSFLDGLPVEEYYIDEHGEKITFIKNDKERKRLKQLLNKTSGKNYVSKEELKELDLLIRKYWNYN